MSETLKLTLPFPPSANEYWRPARGRGLVPSDDARRYKALVRSIARAQPLVGDVAITVWLYRPRRAGDLDNRLKVLFDALTGIAWLDDAQVAEITARRLEDCTRPRAEITVEGASFATEAEVREHAEKVDAANTKRRKTLRKNRASKAGLRLAPNVIRERR